MMLSAEDLEAYKIGGTLHPDYDKMSAYMMGKGGGSAYGGQWRPSKPEDERLVGKPGEIKTTFKRDGTRIDTIIGKDGYAIKERHHTKHSPNGIHSNPHDHIINWTIPRMGIPNFSEPINYWDYIPEFKCQRSDTMAKYLYNSPEENRFKTISEFKESMICGGEIVFKWNGMTYGAFRLEEPKGKYYIAFADGSNEKWCDTPDEILEYMVDGGRLRDVITQVEVIERTI